MPRLFALALVLFSLQALAAEPAPPALKDPVKQVYQDYRPDFLEYINGKRRDFRGWDIPEKLMRLSSEPEFYTLNIIDEDSRANALIQAAIEKEAQGKFRDALKMYQIVIEQFPDAPYRVSRFGIFVPVAQYCQRRILGFPAEELAHYRTLYDARAGEAFDQARRRHSLIGLSEVVDGMLATSYGGQALLTLGMSALDRGHYLEALENFEQVWADFPDASLRGAELAMSIALCRKVLGQSAGSGERYGLVGHWKLDEKDGRKAADVSEFKNDGTLPAEKMGWTEGKQGGAVRSERGEGVAVAASGSMHIGVGGAGFSAALWLKWESGSYPNAIFAKKGRNPSEMLSLEVVRGEKVRYSIATESPTWETGTTRGSVAVNNWTHVAIVVANNEVKVFLNGRLDLRERLKGRVLQNLAGVFFGQHITGAVDDVRLYNRPLLDREVAEFAGTLGKASMTATPAQGMVPLTVEFAHAGGDAGAGANFFWEFGDGETATGPKIKHTYQLGGQYTALLTVTDASGAVSVARAMVDAKWPPRTEGFVRTMGVVLDTARSQKAPGVTQLASAPNITADDYTLMQPPKDPMALAEPTWTWPLPGSRDDYFVFTQPVVTETSIIYRHKNIVYCHSILNGQLRWEADLGGRAVWQNWREHQFPQEDILVQDGLVFATISKGGPSLVAFDEVTGQVRWAYGPMVASTVEETRMRFEAAPAGGPRTVYAGYILDNIEGDTHIDSEYGVIAFDSTNGRIRWRRRLCTLSPGKFAAGFAEQRRNKIRSFSSPPLCHEGTVYYCTNAGAIAALDALSGRVKWLAKYPYHPGIHDATREFQGTYPLVPGRRGLRLWRNQRPLVVGEQLYMLPVNSPFLFCMDRRTGRIQWSKPKDSGDVCYFMGPISTGELLLVYSGRGRGNQIHWYGGDSANPIQLLDPTTGATVWSSGDLMLRDDSPVMKHYIFGTCVSFDMNRRWIETNARPFVTKDDRLYVTTIGDASIWWRPGCHVHNLTEIDLRERRIMRKRRYYTSELLAHADWIIHQAGPGEKRALEDLPHRDERAQYHLNVLKEIVVDTVPVNEHGPFMGFSRITFERYGVPFELRFGPRVVSMLYDRAAVADALKNRTDTAADFARAELLIAESRFEQASALLRRCLQTISSEDVDFRALINQQLYQVHKRLCQAGVRANQPERELENCLGMSRTANTLADEMETLFALSEAYERRGDPRAAARCLGSIISTYGPHEYPVSPVAVLDPDGALAAAKGVLERAVPYSRNPFYGEEFGRSLSLIERGLPLYRSTVSPLPKTLTVRAGELAAARLVRLQKTSTVLAQDLEAAAAETLRNRPPEEQLYLLWQFPGTATAQRTLDALFALAAQKKGDARMEDLWRLADTARVCGLQVPEAHRAAVLAVPRPETEPAVIVPVQEREADIADDEGINWLVLERRGDRSKFPNLLLLGGRVRKRLDNKFILRCFDLDTGKMVWDRQNIRLRGSGQEPGFFAAFVHDDYLVVHGLYDVLAFDIRTGAPRWRYQVPFDFEIKSSAMSGDMFIIAGTAETVALYIPTPSEAGQVAWQVKEMGDLYTDPYFLGDRLVSVRKMPFNLTVRFRATGKLIGRLALPDLSLFTRHPLVENGPEELPVAHDANLLALTDGWYYIVVDVERLAIVWKRLIDANDLTREPPLRFALKGDYLAVLKEDYDQKVIHMLSSRTGELLWRTDPKDSRSPQPVYSMLIEGETLYGIGLHPGQAFKLVARDCKTGKLLFSEAVAGYGEKPQVAIIPRLFGDCAAATVQDRQDFELKLFSTKTGKVQHTLKRKGVGPFGIHGRVSGTVQNGRLILLSKDKLAM